MRIIFRIHFGKNFFFHFGSAIIHESFVRPRMQIVYSHKILQIANMYHLVNAFSVEYAWEKRNKSVHLVVYALANTFI